jgi:hypothetical protein
MYVTSQSYLVVLLILKHTKNPSVKEGNVIRKDPMQEMGQTDEPYRYDL